MKQLVLPLFVLICIVSQAVALYGGDVSEPYDKATLKCAFDHGWRFICIRSYHSYGGVDTNVGKTLSAAREAGIPERDIYHFPCYGRVSASQQMQDDVKHVGKDNFGTLWFDIETNTSPGCEWSGNKGDNCRFLGEMMAEGRNLGIRMGVYASAYMWGQIMGDCTVGAHLPLWYAHYDGSASFGDFRPFGGWSKPTLKQYNDKVGICGLNADADWRP